MTRKATDRSISDAAASLDARIARLRGALGDPFNEDPRLSSYATALAHADAARKGPPASPPKPAFIARADAVLAAHEIALAEITSDAASDVWSRLTWRAAALFNVESIRRGHVRTVTALKSLETAFFTQWHEGPPTETRGFWRAVARAGLPFVRRDLLAEIFERGRITTREHYEFAVDSLVVAEQAGALDATGVARLARLIGDYEAR